MNCNYLTISLTCTLLVAFTFEARADDAVGRARATDSARAAGSPRSDSGIQSASHRCDDARCQTCDSATGNGVYCDVTRSTGQNRRNGSGNYAHSRSSQCRAGSCNNGFCKNGRCNNGPCSTCKSGYYSGDGCHKKGCHLCGAWKNKKNKFCKQCALYWPDYGWAPPIHVPVDDTRSSVQYQRYWPSRWLATRPQRCPNGLSTDRYNATRLLLSACANVVFAA